MSFVNIGSTVEFVLRSPVPGREIEAVTIDVHREPEIAIAIINLLTAPPGDGPDLPETIHERLSELGVLVPEVIVPRFGGDGVPAPAATARMGSEPLPHWVQTDDCLPTDLHHRVFVSRQWSRRRPLLWVEDPTTRMVFPSWALAARADGGDLVGEEHVRSTLSDLGAMKTAEEIRELGERFRDAPRAARESLARNGYWLIRDFIPAHTIPQFAKYFSTVRQAGYFRSDDSFVDGRIFIHREPVCEAFHKQFAAYITHALQESIAPSYSFLAIYQQGCTLNRHRDRPQCKWNFSIQFDSPGRRGGCWPFFVEHEGKTRKVELNPGDAVLYQGRSTEHWREQLTEGESCLGIFHFVDSSFQGSRD